MMEKILHVVRHGQATHNIVKDLNELEHRRDDFEDAELTEVGISQCHQLSNSLEEKLSKIDLLVTSPLNRAVQTSINAFNNLQNIIPWISLDFIRERTGFHPCDKRRSINEKMMKYPTIDFSAIEEDDDLLYAQYLHEREPLPAVHERARKFLKWLATREEKEIIMVSHGAFIEEFVLAVLNLHKTGDVCAFESTSFRNCELRSIRLTWDDNNLIQARYSI